MSRLSRLTAPLRGLRAIVLGSLVALGACAPQAPGPGFVGMSPLAPQPVGPVQGPRAQVALLLPLTGQNAALGNAMLNAAQLALFEQGAPGFEFVPRDTGGTPAGAAEAARAAIASGARVLVGPLTGGETAAAASVARGSGVPMLAMTNDATLGAPGVWVLGVTPAQQVRRAVASAAQNGARKFAMAAPEGPFARQLAAELRASVAQLGLPAPVVVTYPAAASLPLAARDLAQRIGEGGADVLLLGESGQRARDFAAALPQAGFTTVPKLMGSALWLQDAGLANEPAMAGAIFPGPDPGARAGFENRYQTAFGEQPSRIAATAYDGAALAARAMRAAGPGGMAPALPVGEVFLGADGALRLLPDGQTQRALAVFAIQPGAPPQMVDPATLPGGPES